MQDRDTSLFPSLQEGVKTGFHRDIPVSDISNLVDNALSIHLTN